MSDRTHLRHTDSQEPLHRTADDQRPDAVSRPFDPDGPRLPARLRLRQRFVELLEQRVSVGAAVDDNRDRAAREKPRATCQHAEQGGAISTSRLRAMRRAARRQNSGAAARWTPARSPSARSRASRAGRRVRRQASISDLWAWTVLCEP
jgi:hypothetical protein